MTEMTVRLSTRARRSAPLPIAFALATLTLAGCACDEAGWKTDVAYNSGTPYCNFDSLDRRSKASAALVERADPNLLEIARLEAERDCYKAAEARARKSI
jgi:hypothetical protein